jgi:hypothetical protein
VQGDGPAWIEGAALGDPDDTGVPALPQALSSSTAMNTRPGVSRHSGGIGRIPVDL